MNPPQSYVTRTLPLLLCLLTREVCVSSGTSLVSISGTAVNLDVSNIRFAHIFYSIDTDLHPKLKLVCCHHIPRINLLKNICFGKHDTLCSTLKLKGSK